MERCQFTSVTQSYPTLCDPVGCSMPGSPVPHELLNEPTQHEPTQTHVIKSVMPSSHLIFHHSPFSSHLKSFSVSRSFPMSQLHIRWPKYWSFCVSISPSNEYSGLISFRMDWLDLLAVQGTLKSLLQHHSSKASILRCSAFFTVQVSYPYMISGKTIALTRRTFVGKVTSLLFNVLSRYVIAFLPRTKHLLISWLQSPSTVILEPKEIKSGHCFHCFPIYLP